MHGIEWLNRSGTTGESWNPITGCTPISEGCTNCYARRMARRLAGRFGYPEVPHEFDVTLHPDRLEDPLHWRKPRTVFVCSMSDLFHKDVPFEFIDMVVDRMELTPQHTYIILTKRPQRMHEYWQMWNSSDLASGWRWPANIWGLVTAENQRCADERIPWLIKTPFAVRGVSIEPMLGPVDPFDVDGHIAVQMEEANRRELRYPADVIDWVICGAETGPGARSIDFAWARDLRDQCAAAGTPFFWKRAGPGQTTPPDLAAVRQWPERLRQGKHR